MDVNVLSLFPIGAGVGDTGHLIIGGCDTVDLALRFGTPLYVYDEETVRRQCSAHLSAFAASYHSVSVHYAAKAYLGMKLARIMREEGLGIDVVSGGEMHVARAAGFAPQRVCFHGNNKSHLELEEALGWGVGRIAVDNLDELRLLELLAAERGALVDILLRLAPAVDPHTHRYIATGVADSKFGLPIAGGMAASAAKAALESPSLRLRGYHVHIGSQIHELDAYRQAVDALISFAAQIRDELGFSPEEISLGGGWAVRYTPGELAPQPADVAAVLAGALSGACSRHGLPLPALGVEPGRSLVARAGVALYAVGGAKDIPGIRRYVFVDGGMADNIRPALYGARYTAVVANRASAEPDELVTVAGRYCESGDIVISDTLLASPRGGDILAVAACGAYAPAMASNYNLALRPAIVGVAGGAATLWRRRETYADLLRCEQ